ncbi:phage tail tip lysozyme [Nocardia sp. NPDC052254]|uniref:phage tail tip lysozyme n=1 Tax=Nocardia sp. NPDC052254 TaxID=3155681 RepID=UPI00341DCB59
MAESVNFPRVAGATLLNSAVSDLETVLEALLNGVGNGTAEKKVMAALTQIGKKPPEITSEMVSNYDTRQQKIKKYNDEWDSLDTHMSDIAENSAGVSKQTRAAVKELESDIKEIILTAGKEINRSTKPERSLDIQLRAVGAIDKAVEEAGVLVSKAHQAHNANSGKIPKTPADTGGSGGGSSPSFPAVPIGIAPTSYSGGGGGVSPASYSNGSPTPLEGSERDRAKHIYERLINEYHLSPAQAAGIVGNMQVEAPGLNPNAENPGEGAIGLCQWEGGRRHNLEVFAAKRGVSEKNLDVQVDFLMHELSTSEKGAYGALVSTDTPETAAAAFDKSFERSSGEARGQRMANATGIARMMSSVAV